jgi:diguanylate cyclase (GGDEF)-like protein
MRIMRYLPQGRMLPEDVWRRRHRTLTFILRAHVLGVFLFGLLRGYSVSHAAVDTGPILLFSLLVIVSDNRGFSSAMAALGLVMSSAVLVHLSGGVIEMHFHFFVMVGLLTLYQDWLPFLLAVGFVVAHHALLGTAHPHDVYNHPAAFSHPFKWALIHGLFLSAASVASIAAWRLNEEQALHDSLTRLANRTLFRDRVGHALARVQRRAVRLAVLFVDLDGFKNVNDTLGHAAGDEALVAMAGRVSGCIRAADTAARLGGDEFAVLLEDIHSEDEAVQVAERLLEALLQPLHIRGKELAVGASIGVAVNVPGESIDDLMRHADVAMYSAKAAGRGRHATFESGMDIAVIEGLRLDEDLFHAVQGDELVLHYQPLIALDTGSLAGVEALVRWNHPERGLLWPDSFIAAAEANGAIIPIGEWVLAEACRQGQRWRQRFPDRRFTMSVNLSPRQLFQHDIVATVAAALRDSGLPAESLVLELTEGVMTHDFAGTSRQLGALKALGVQLAIDDFGTGYSSMSALRQLPFDILKIDKLFVDGITGATSESAFAHAILKLARVLELETVAEGVEQRDQAEHLRDLHCDLGQGYHFAKPLSADGIDAILGAGSFGNGWLAVGGTAEADAPASI